MIPSASSGSDVLPHPTPATGWCRPFALAARAAAKVAPDEIAQLGVILDEHQNAIAADDMERVADLGQAFHRAINQAADSPSRAPAQVRGQESAESLLRPGRGPGLRHPHQASLLLDALRSHQVRRGKSLREQHILVGADRLIEVL
ncbi:FCD domain-containing protein [Streptomyces sp. NPDC056690]|uniref:FCD domain-containing protein n=1 Tax=unclassified Streptomyces TaxID=2593676 RepID=UPI0036259243